MNYRDIDRVIYIKKHCNNIEEILNNHKHNYDEFISNCEFQTSIMFCISQIGELATGFSDEFRNEYRDIPFRDIIATRNRIIHGYTYIKNEIIWNVCIEDIPRLKVVIDDIIKESDICPESINYQI